MEGRSVASAPDQQHQPGSIEIETMRGRQLSVSQRCGQSIDEGATQVRASRHDRHPVRFIGDHERVVHVEDLGFFVGLRLGRDFAKIRNTPALSVCGVEIDRTVAVQTDQAAPDSIFPTFGSDRAKSRAQKLEDRGRSGRQRRHDHKRRTRRAYRHLNATLRNGVTPA